jgi:hypothetical protein
MESSEQLPRGAVDAPAAGQLEPGDVVESVDGEPITTAEALQRARVQRDSLASVADSLAGELVRMDQELQRIRRLLLPDTARSTDPGGGRR